MIPRFRTILSAVCLVTSVAAAQAQGIHARPTARIHDKIDRHVRKTLPGSHPAVVDEATIGSLIDPGTQLTHMILVLDPSDDQKTALHSLLDAQQDKNSPSYHKWLTPDTYAQDFGVAPSDIAQVSAFLADSGLTVDTVSRSGRFISFSGSAASVQTAFGTQIHKVTVNGEQHISNTTDVSVPLAIAAVVKGVARLSDFAPRSSSQNQWKKVSVPVTANGEYSPLVSYSSGTHYVGAGDIAKIYNSKPLTDAGYTGKGVSIAVVAQSNIQLSDVEAYRSLFGLPKNDPKIIVVDQDPGENADDFEAFLDAEMAGALATDAQVNFVVSNPTLVGGGVNSAALYIVDNNIGDIVTMSYGGCEKTNTKAGTAFWNTLWEIAAAQGQTVFVSSGDSGASGCTSSSATSAGTAAYGVNALGVSAYNVSVGGTMFVDYGPSQFWSATNPVGYASALGYVPEAAMNQGTATTTLLNDAATASTTGSGVFASGGGISVYTQRPPWQTGSGISPTADPTAASGTGLGSVSDGVTGPHRLSPDVSMIAAYGHDGTMMCAEGFCTQTTSGGLTSAIVIGGTSVAAPAFASVQALINSYNGNARQGNANYHYYALAAQQYNASSTACQANVGTAANTTVVAPASTCNFHDVIAGSNIVLSSAKTPASIGFNAVAGYDAATGLGSPNITNLAHNWSSVNFNSTTTTLSLTPTTAAHGTNVGAAIQVASTNGTPTGDVGIVAVLSTGNTAQYFTLSNGSVNGTVAALPGGTYSVYAHYAGDGTFAPSDSAPVTVTISKENSTVAVTPYVILSSGSYGSVSSYTYGAGEYHMSGQVASVSKNGAPSGSMTYTVTRSDNAPMPSLTVKLDANGIGTLISGPSFPSFDFTANYQTLPVGVYTFKGTYNGDNSLNSSFGTTTLTITQATATVSLSTSTAEITTGATATLNVVLATPAGAASPSGMVTFTDTSVTPNAVLGTATLSGGVAVFTTNALTTTGTHAITATYAGDTNFKSAVSSKVNVVVGTPTAPTFTLTTTTGSAAPVVGGVVSVTATLGVKPAATTAVYFYVDGSPIGSANMTTAVTAINITISSVAAGQHAIKAVFLGNSTQLTTNATLNVSVAKQATTIGISGGSSATYGQSVSLSGTIYRTGSTATTVPVPGLTGTVNFYDGSTSGTLLGSATPIFGPGAYAAPYVGTVSLSNLTVGTHNIVAVYTGDANYFTSSSTSVPVVINKVAQTITFTGLPSSATYGAGAGPYTLTATASSGLPVTYSVSGPATISGSTLNITGSGTVVVTASQAGNATIAAATPVSQTIVVGTLSISATQTIANVSGNYVVTITVKNTGTGLLQNVTVSNVIIGTTTGTPASQTVGNLTAGSSASVSFTVPGTAGAHGAAGALKYTGSYTGGTFGGSYRVTLP